MGITCRLGRSSYGCVAHGPVDRNWRNLTPWLSNFQLSHYHLHELEEYLNDVLHNFLHLHNLLDLCIAMTFMRIKTRAGVGRYGSEEAQGRGKA